MKTLYEDTIVRFVFMLAVTITMTAHAQCVQETRRGGNHPPGPIMRAPYVNAVVAAGQPVPNDGMDNIVGTRGIVRIKGGYLAANSGTRTEVITPEWSTDLNGTQVLVNGSPVPLQLVSDNEIIAQIPGGTLTGAELIVKTANGCESGAVGLKVYPVAPSFVTKPDGSVAVAKNADGSYTVMAYGLGDVINGGLEDGKPAPAAKATLYPVDVTINGRPADVMFAGTSTKGVGLYEIRFIGHANFRGGPLTVRVTQLGLTSTFTLQ